MYHDGKFEFGLEPEDVTPQDDPTADGLSEETPGSIQQEALNELEGKVDTGPVFEEDSDENDLPAGGSESFGPEGSDSERISAEAELNSPMTPSEGGDGDGEPPLPGQAGVGGYDEGGEKMVTRLTMNPAQCRPHNHMRKPWLGSL